MFVNQGGCKNQRTFDKPRGQVESRTTGRTARASETFSDREVCQIFCVNDEVLFLGWVREGRGSIPSLAQRCRRILCFHDATLSRAGIRSGHRTVKWFKASRQ